MPEGAQVRGLSAARTFQAIACDWRGRQRHDDRTGASLTVLVSAARFLLRPLARRIERRSLQRDKRPR